MKSNGITFKIVVGGKPVTEYPLQKNGLLKHFVEGREGSEYELHVTNNSDGQVSAVISVDGRSIVDGKEAGSTSRGYVIGCGSRLVVPGWLVDGTTAAKFAFAGKKESYAAQMSDGDTTNVGVIGIRVYSKKIIHDDAEELYSLGASIRSALDKLGDIDDVDSPQNIGTEFGDPTEFTTTRVHFERGRMLCEMVLFYDNAAGLRKRGIDISPEGKRFAETPSAFPADLGCTPPASWNGNR